MGHTEMLLAVAGLDQQQIKDRSELLASGSWASFTPAEQAAFAFARKHAVAPAEITPQDVQQLMTHFGAARALDAIWWSSRCHFMTRVADGLQLPLERENVFQDRSRENESPVPPMPEEGDASTQEAPTGDRPLPTLSP
jgi:hypothetical protein